VFGKIMETNRLFRGEKFFILEELGRKEERKPRIKKGTEGGEEMPPLPGIREICQEKDL